MIRHMSKKIDIIKRYLNNYNKSYSGRELSRALNINHQTALNHLKELVKEKILLSSTKGRNYEYELNKENIITEYMLRIAELYKSMESFSNKELKILINEIIPYCEGIILFGSFASSTFNKESDIDLIIVGKSDKNKINKIIENHPRTINIEYISYNDFKKSLNQKKALAIEILKNHIIYNNVSKIVKIFLEFYKK